MREQGKRTADYGTAGRLRRCVSIRLLHLLERHTPEVVVWIQLQILKDVTERAFGRRNGPLKPGSWSLLPFSGRDALAEYAALTVNCLKKACAVRDRAKWEECRRRLYLEAWRTGDRIRRITGFTKHEDVTRLVIYLYRNIGISMEGRIPGEIQVSGCYFSDYYTPQMCRLMSYMDAGIIAGISGGSRLRFTERITEGCGKCRAGCSGESF